MYKAAVCYGTDELNSFITKANENYWRIVSVTEVHNPTDTCLSKSRYTIIYEERDYEEEFWG